MHLFYEPNENIAKNRKICHLFWGWKKLYFVHTKKVQIELKNVEGGKEK